MVGFLALWMGFIFQRCQAIIFTNEWAIRISGDHDSVDRIAANYDFTNMGQIGHLENHYSFRHNGTAQWSTVSNRDLTALIIKEIKVEWLQQQEVHSRGKRNSRASHIYSIDIKTKHASSSQPPSHTPSLYFNDPQWSSLWYIHCSNGSRGCQSHMNIEAAWRRGYSGKGVVVSVLDDGIEWEHPDLKQNYDPNASYDVNSNDHDPSPFGASDVNYHGTECAGMVAAAANNSQCIVGIAFHARIGGIRMLDGNVTDLVEAQALSFGPQHIDIYSASWGPQDDGATLEGPGPLARLALQSGVHTGREGRGSVYVWASGNGGRHGDHCSCDGYTNSIYTISVSSCTQGGGRPEYLERCSSTLAAAYGGGEDERSSLVTLGRRQGCSRDRSGTSLSSPMAAGVIALALDANPLLTWRDVQHIIVRTSQSGHLSAPDWHTNGAGYKGRPYSEFTMAVLQTGGQLELEVRPLFLVPDTNGFIDHLAGLKTLLHCGTYVLVVPLIVITELDGLAKGQDNMASGGGGGMGTGGRGSGSRGNYNCSDDGGGGGAHARGVQERARLAVNFLERGFEAREPCLRALTSRGSHLESIAFRSEDTTGQQGNNDDVILSCCLHYCKDKAKDFMPEQRNGPVRMRREVVLLTDDRNLRVKALTRNVPVRDIPAFISWAKVG